MGTTITHLAFTHKFPYQVFGKYIKPVIPVSFSFNGQEFSFPMLVDSGAFATALPPDCAAVFGIEDITHYRRMLGMVQQENLYTED